MIHTFNQQTLFHHLYKQICTKPWQWCSTDLVQRSHWNLPDIIGDVLPGGALGVARSHSLSVPQVFYREKESLCDILLKNIQLSLIFQISFKSVGPTVLIYSVDWGQSNGNLLQLLFGWRWDVVPTVSCRERYTSERQCSSKKSVVSVILTCRSLGRYRTSVKGRTILGDGPHLTGRTDGDGLESLVSSYVEPGGSLSDQREDIRTSTLF